MIGDSSVPPKLVVFYRVFLVSLCVSSLVLVWYMILNERSTYKLMNPEVDTLPFSTFSIPDLSGTGRVYGT